MRSPRPYQNVALQNLALWLRHHPGKLLTVMFPRQSGKNELLAALAGALLIPRASTGGSLVVCAPTRTPQANISLERLLTHLRRTVWAPAAIRLRPINDHTVGVGRARAIFLSASPAAHVAGHTASIALFADEAQDIDAEWFTRQFSPMAASTGASTVMFGTAWDGHSLLEVSARRAKALSHRLPKHFQVSWEEVGAANSAYRRYVLGERARLGPTHPLFLTQYELLPARGAGRLLSASNLRNLEGAHPRLRRPLPGERYVGGLDVGGESAGADASVLVIARVTPGGAVEVVDLHAWAAERFAALRTAVTGLARSWRLERLVVDATGLGGPVASDLADALGDRVEPLKVTGEVKSSLGYALIAAANTRNLSVFAADASEESSAVWHELRTLRADHRAGNQISWGSTAGDDHAFALALALRAASQIPARRVAVGRQR